MNYKWIGLGLLCCFSSLAFSTSSRDAAYNRACVQTTSDMNEDPILDFYADSSSDLYADSSSDLYGDSSSDLYGDSSSYFYEDSSSDFYGDLSANAYGDSNSDFFTYVSPELCQNADTDLIFDVSDEQSEPKLKTLAAYRAESVPVVEGASDMIEVYRIEAEVVSLTGYVMFSLRDHFDVEHEVYFSMNHGNPIKIDAGYNTEYAFILPQHEVQHLSWIYKSAGQVQHVSELSWIQELNFFKTEQLSLSAIKEGQLAYQMRVK